MHQKTLLSKTAHRSAHEVDLALEPRTHITDKQVQPQSPAFTRLDWMVHAFRQQSMRVAARNPNPA
jgi:hypothetical protein